MLQPSHARTHFYFTWILQQELKHRSTAPACTSLSTSHHFQQQQDAGGQVGPVPLLWVVSAPPHPICSPLFNWTGSAATWALPHTNKLKTWLNYSLTGENGERTPGPDRAWYLFKLQCILPIGVRTAGFTILPHVINGLWTHLSNYRFLLTFIIMTWGGSYRVCNKTLKHFLFNLCFWTSKRVKNCTELSPALTFDLFAAFCQFKVCLALLFALCIVEHTSWRLLYKCVTDTTTTDPNNSWVMRVLHQDIVCLHSAFSIHWKRSCWMSRATATQMLLNLCDQKVAELWYMKDGCCLKLHSF